MIGFGTDIYYADATGKPATPPANQIENPETATRYRQFLHRGRLQRRIVRRVRRFLEDREWMPFGTISQASIPCFQSRGSANLESGLHRQQLQPGLPRHGSAGASRTDAVHHSTYESTESRAAALPPRGFLALLRGGLGERRRNWRELELLQHLQSISIFQADHDRIRRCGPT